MGTRAFDELGFYQVEISDTAVIIKGDMYGRPDTWASIASSSVSKGKQTGKIYQLVRATGIQLDNKEVMPASWNRSFTLQFQPVDKRDKSVDFDEVPSGGDGFRVNGITLDKKGINDQFIYPFRDENERLVREDKKETPEMKALHELAEKTKDKEELDKIFKKARQLVEEGKAYTTEYKTFEKRSQDMYAKMQAFQNEYIKSNPTLVGLYILAQQVERMRNSEDATPYITIYRTVYTDKFPDHPMTKYLKNWIESNEIKVGGKFIDFTAPDLNGTQHRLSDEIKGKVALIDLWASWCGS